jgi:ATP-dependent phosphoenolpyruvate carboxykinase
MVWVQIPSREEQKLTARNLLIKQVEDEQVMIEMSWIDGTVHESMNQVLQYLKNKLKSSD